MNTSRLERQFILVHEEPHVTTQSPETSLEAKENTILGLLPWSEASPPGERKTVNQSAFNRNRELSKQQTYDTLAIEVTPGLRFKR